MFMYFLTLFVCLSVQVFISDSRKRAWFVVVLLITSSFAGLYNLSTQWVRTLLLDYPGKEGGVAE